MVPDEANSWCCCKTDNSACRPFVRQGCPSV